MYRNCGNHDSGNNIAGRTALKTARIVGSDCELQLRM